MNTPQRLPLAKRITQGPACLDNQDDDVPYLPINVKVGNARICQLWLDDAPVPDFNAMQRDNARFIVQAFNVTHETGKTPQQLADELKEAAKALEQLLSPWKHMPPACPLARSRVKAYQELLTRITTL